jgi:uncharacterized protein (TIGR03086 family)
MSDSRQHDQPAAGMLEYMADCFTGIVDRFVLASADFEQCLRSVRREQWSWPTPCPEWTVRQLVNHMTRGNLSYVHLLHGGTNADFLCKRDVDALGTDPVSAYVGSVQAAATAFTQGGALDRILDHPLGKITGRQALAVRTTDSVIHTWDLATAIVVDNTLDPDLVAWIDEHIEDIYADLAETPIAADSTHRFFAAPQGHPPPSAQDRLLHRMGRV